MKTDLKKLNLTINKQDETAIRYAIDWAIEKVLEQITDDHTMNGCVDDELVEHLAALNMAACEIGLAAQQRDRARNNAQQNAERKQRELEFNAQRWVDHCKKLGKQ
jgi:hypothetical protein